MTESWKVYALSLATTLGVAFVFCAISIFCYRLSGCLLKLRRPVHYQSLGVHSLT